jgi:hypothetical protein
MPEPLKITLDTNLIRDIWDDRPGREEMTALLEIAEAGAIELMISRRVEQDIPRSPLADKIESIPQLGVELGPVIWRLGRGGRLGQVCEASQAFADFYPEAVALASKRITGRTKPPSDEDLDHVHTHYVAERDVFLTSDKGLLCIADAFKERFGIVVLTPAQFLEFHARGENPAAGLKQAPLD